MSEVKTRLGGRVERLPDPAQSSVLDGVDATNTDVRTLTGTRPFPVGGIVSADQVTVFGDGTVAHPLSTSGGAGGGELRFEYTVLGTEPDLSELVIPLPTARPTTDYEVTPAQSTATFLLDGNVQASSKTTTHFTLSLSGNASAGDVFTFLVSDPT